MAETSIHFGKLCRRNNKVTVGAMYIVANHGRYVQFCLEGKAMQTIAAEL